MSGIIFLRREITTLEQIRTIIAARPIDAAWNTDLVVARVGPVPRMRMRTGFSVMIPRRSIESFLLLVAINRYLLLWY